MRLRRYPEKLVLPQFSRLVKPHHPDREVGNETLDLNASLQRPFFPCAGMITHESFPTREWGGQFPRPRRWCGDTLPAARNGGVSRALPTPAHGGAVPVK